MLTESQCAKIEKALTEDVEPRKLAAYLCLHMGLTVAEASALRVGDIDFEANTLAVKRLLSKAASPASGRYVIVEDENSRVLPMPPHVARLLKESLRLYPNRDCYIISGGNEVPGAHLLQNVLSSVNKKYAVTDKLTALKLRNAFIRRCLEAGIDLYTVASYIGIRQIDEIQGKFAAYLKARLEQISLLERYAAGCKAPERPASSPARRMNLLILGAGSQGPVVKETAQALGVFREIAFLDDAAGNSLAIDACANYKKYVDEYPIAMPSFGNCELRAKWLDRLEEAGFILPTLIHPMATVSPSAVVGEGTVVEMKAIIGTGARIGRGCIISSGAVVDLNAVVGEYVHVGSAAAVKKDAVVSPFSVIHSGEVFG